MCGIAGALAFNPSAFSITERYITRMCNVMAHRGPDAAGAWVSADARIGLGHRRLSIIDLSDSAGQPMSNRDGTLWVSFNGEIYNHAEIRAELESRHNAGPWKTDHSDTEVILHAYAQWGIGFLEKLRGMFAIALWDAKKHALWLIRDRIGIKPLYYAVRPEGVIFASEIKALLQDPAQPREVNEEAFFHYLSFLTTPAPQTLFNGIMKLPPGCWLRFSEDGRAEQHNYWDVLDNTSPLTGVSDNKIAEQLLQELRTSVQLRKVSDVPMGVFLSGGIDSSTNAALFSEGEVNPVKTFTIGFEGNHGSYRNEYDYAEMMAKRLGSEHHTRELTSNDLLTFLPKMIHLQDEPIGDPVCMPVYYVSKLARDNGVIVCQVGEGADELFCGYEGWRMALILQKLGGLPVPRAMKNAWLSILRMRGKEHTLKYEWLRRNANGLPVFWGGAEGYFEAEKRRLLSERLRTKFRDLSSWDALSPIRKKFMESAWEKSHLNWMSYLDLRMRLPELLLMRVDKMSMGVSLEARVPFLDHKFVEFAMSIPESVKTRNYNLKYILKKAVRGIIPDELIDRKKQGFGVPLHEWFAGALGDTARARLSDFCDQTDFLDRAEVMRLLDNPKSRSTSWYLLNFALWWEKFIK